MNSCPGYSVHLIVIAMTYHLARLADECFAAIDQNFTLRYIISTFEQNFSMPRRKNMFVCWNADKMHEKELCNVIYIVATVFRINDCEQMTRVQTWEVSVSGHSRKTRYVCNYLPKINCIWTLNPFPTTARHPLQPAAILNF